MGLARLASKSHLAAGRFGNRKGYLSTVMVKVKELKGRDSTVPIGFSDHPPSEGSRSLNPARPLKPESGYNDQLVAKASKDV